MNKLYLKNTCAVHLALGFGLLFLVVDASPTAAQQIPDYQTSWIGNTWGNPGGQNPNNGDDKWVQNFIAQMECEEDGTCFTTSRWDEHHREYGVYKDGDVLGNDNRNINNKDVWINGVKWYVDGTNVRNENGKVVTDAGKPVALGKTPDGRLLVVDDGARQQVLFYDISNNPTLVETFGIEGGIGASFSINYDAAQRDELNGLYPAGNYPRGAYHPFKLTKTTGVGMDTDGTLIVSTNHPTSIRWFNKVDGQWKVEYELHNLFFVDATDIDYASDGKYIVGVNEIIEIDYSKKSGREWKIKAITQDPLQYPSDERLDDDIQDTDHNAALYRTMGGKRFMFTMQQWGGSFDIFKFEDEPSYIAFQTGTKTPTGGSASWIDTNGDLWNGEEFFEGKPYISWRKFVDLDGNGMPQWANPIKIERPDGMGIVTRFRYYPEQDDAFFTGYTQSLPLTGKEAPQEHTGRVIYKYNNFTKDTRSIPSGFPVETAYKNMDCGWECINQRIIGMDIQVAGDYVFFMWFLRGPLLESKGGDLRGEISVYERSNGQYVGGIIPGEEVGGPRTVGWMDIKGLLGSAMQRVNGEYIIVQEEDGFGKNMFYRWSPTGGNPPTLDPVVGVSTTQVAASADDAEQDLGGAVNLTSNDLDFRLTNLSGLRFKLEVPPGASVDQANIAFTAKGNGSGSNTLSFRVEASGNAPAFSGTTQNLSSRSTESTSVEWSPGNWTDGQVYTSPDLSSLIQQLVNRSDYQSGNHIVVTVRTNASNSDKRSARSFDYNGNSSQAPSLTVNYTPTANARQASVQKKPLLEAEEIRMFPNPASREVRFGKKINLKLYNSQGRLVFSGSQIDHLNVTAFPEGLYIIKSDALSSKLIIEH
jgi:hypothetical protein